MIAFPVQSYFERFTRAFVAERLAAAGRFQTMRFPDGEACAFVREGVAGEDCLLVGTIAPPDQQIVEFLTLADALKRAGSRRLTAFLPYLAYCRQDTFSTGQSGGIATVTALLRAVGIDRIVTIDVHSELDNSLAKLPIHSLQPWPDLFVEPIRNLGWADITVVAPNKKAVARNQALACALGSPRPVAYVAARPEGVAQIELAGDIGENVVLADDILGSGRTLVTACNLLRQKGARQIALAVTHGLFQGSIWKELFDLGVTAVFTTDSCPEALTTGEPKIQVVSIKPLLRQVSS